MDKNTPPNTEPINQKLIEIVWIDSRGTNELWELLDEIEPLVPAECKSVGFLIDDSEDYKTLAHTVSHDQVMGRISIPTRCIITQRSL